METKKNTIKLTESELKRVISESVKRVLNEEFGIDMQDTLAWVQKKNPNMSPKEQQRFAQNIINKRGKSQTSASTNTPSPAPQSQDSTGNFWDDFDYSKTYGVKLPVGPTDDLPYAFTPREIKTRIVALKKAITNVMDLFNGGACGEDLCNEIEDECRDFYYFITQYVSDLGGGMYLDGVPSADYSDVPYLRKTDPNTYCFDNFYTKDGKVFDDRMGK